MKIIVALVISLLLTGCIYQTASNGDISDAINICKDHGGINHVTIIVLGSESVTCQDDYWSWLHK